MKTKILITLFAVFLSIPVTAKALVIQADGMMCQACVETVTESFQTFDNVENVTVDLENQTITIDAQISDEDIKKLLDSHGYKMISVTR